MSFFSSIEKSLQDFGKEVDRAVDGATHLSIADRLKPGNVIQIKSKLCNKSLRILENGTVDCGGDGGSACHFRIVNGQTPGTIKLQHVPMPDNFLAISKGFVVGYGRGGQDCDFIASIASDGQHAIFECFLEQGSHIGVLPSGQITAPAQTNKLTDVSHFKIVYIGSR